MAKALVVYSGRTGQTRKMGEIIAEGMRFSGIEVEVTDAVRIRNEKDLAGFDAYVFGAATYHGEMTPAMKTMLFLAEKAELEGKVGGSFGAYGWSGEAPERIFNTMLNVFQMNMVGDALRLKSVALQGGIQMAQDYGRSIAAKLEQA